MVRPPPSPPSSAVVRRKPYIGWLALVAATVGLLAPAPVEAFTFQFNQTNPKTCEPVEVRWSGGSPPFKMFIIPAYDYPYTVEMDESAWDEKSSSGVYVWNANYPDTILGFVAVMSDSAGLATGGVSSILYMAPGGDPTACDIRNAEADFYFALDPRDGNVPTCSPLGISWGENATDPVEIIGVIPNGNAFVLPTKPNVNGRDWNVNIAAGTPYILTMLDSGTIGNGGSSDFLYSRSSNSTDCIDAAAPSRTPGSTWGTPDGVAATTAQPEPTGGSGGGGGGSSLSAGGIAGAVIGGIVGFAIIQVALLWCLCRNRFRRTLAKSPVDLFSTKAEGQEVGAPVTSGGRRRGLFGLRTDRDVSQYQPEPYYTNPAGQPSNDALVAGGRRAGSGESDPFRDSRGDGSASYLYPAGGGSGADWARRGSHSDAGDSLGSPVSPGGIGLRPMGGSSGRSQGSTPPLSATATPTSPVVGHAGSFLDTDSASPSYATTGVNPLSSTMLTGVSSNRHMPRSSSMLSTPSTVIPPYNPTSTTPAVVRSTKQMLALANPDDDGTLPGPSFVRHRDAGPVEHPLARRREPEPVELPPMYDEIEHRHRQQQEDEEVARVRVVQMDAYEDEHLPPIDTVDNDTRSTDEPRSPDDRGDESPIAVSADVSDRRPA